MATLRFCAYQYQHAPLDVLTQRWRRAEDLGFDVVWNCDTVVEPDAITAQRCARFDELVDRQGRDPRSIRHSLVCFPPLTPWESAWCLRSRTLD